MGIQDPPANGPAKSIKRDGGRKLLDTAFGCARDFLDNRFVYTVVSPRARGLSVGVNMNPDKQCNFDCPYCEVDRSVPGKESALDVDVMAEELERTLQLIAVGGLRERPNYATTPVELLRLKHVALSGDGEPTLCPNFFDAVEAVAHIRAKCKVPFYKVVLITNATGLDRPQVLEGLKLLTRHDEVWAKLEAGTQGYMDKINRPGTISLAQIQQNILNLAKQRPVIIQSLFCTLNGSVPSREEIEQYTLRLQELKNAGAEIPLVQIYSATRPTSRPGCSHLPLKALSQIAQLVRYNTGLPAEVF